MLDRLCELTSSSLSKADRIIVVGDIHGDYESFQRIYDLFDPLRDYLILLGDYADRGAEGIEVIDGVRELIRKHPNRTIALKGNHEGYTEDGQPQFMPCDLIYEANEKRTSWKKYFKKELNPFINNLYLAALVLNKILFVHGGISSKIMNLSDLEHPSKQVEEDILWSDPFEGKGEYLNPRGAGVEFGEDISEEVCNRLSIERIVRSHQPRKAREGPCIEQHGRVVTISSTIIYGGTPFVLALPIKNLGDAFKKLERYVVNLR